MYPALHSSSFTTVLALKLAHQATLDIINPSSCSSVLRKSAYLADPYALLARMPQSLALNAHLHIPSSTILLAIMSVFQDNLVSIQLVHALTALLPVRNALHKLLALPVTQPPNTHSSSTRLVFLLALQVTPT
jgi:hypothetical protein